MDVLLAVCGPSGCYNLGCKQLVQYLVKGRCMRDVMDYSHPDDDDTLLMVSPQWAVVLGHDLQMQVLPSLTSSASASSMMAPFGQTMEELLRQGLAGAKTVGVALVPNIIDSQVVVGNPSIISHWPLLVRYAEGNGCNRMFHEIVQVVNVYPELYSMYGSVDSLDLHHLLSYHIPPLQKHWSALTSLVLKTPTKSRGNLTELQLRAPLMTSYDLAHSNQILDGAMAHTLPPRVLIGARTGMHLTLAAEGVSISQQGASEGHQVMHMTVEGGDPHSPLSLARTFFFTQGHDKHDINPPLGGNLVPSAEASLSRDHHGGSDGIYLMKLYVGVVRAVRAAIHHFAVEGEASSMTSEAVAREVLRRYCQTEGLPLSVEEGSSELHFTMWSTDHTGRVDPCPKHGSPQLKTCRVVLSGVRSVSSQDVLLGAVEYADTFIEAPSSSCVGSSHLVLTQTCTPLATFLCHPSEILVHQQRVRLLASMLQVPSSAASAPPATAALVEEKQQGGSKGAGSSRKDKGGKGTAAARRRSDGHLKQGPFAATGNGGAGTTGKHRTSRSKSWTVLGAPSGAQANVSAGGTSQGGQGPSCSYNAGSGGPTSQAQTPLGALLIDPRLREEVLVLTGCLEAAVLPSFLYCFSHGLVLMGQQIQVVLMMDFKEDLEGVTFYQWGGTEDEEKGAPEEQDRPFRNSPGPSCLGPCLVLTGRQPSCGLFPASQLTDNVHLAISLANVSPTFREAITKKVLPAWRQTCWERKIKYEVVRRGTLSTPKWPLPPEALPVYRYWIHSDVKKYPLLEDDEQVAQIMAYLDEEGRGDMELCPG